MWVKKHQLELDMKQLTGSKLGKGYDKAVYCPPDYLTYRKKTSCETLDELNHKQEYRLLGEIPNNLRYANNSTLMGENEEELRAS